MESTDARDVLGTVGRVSKEARRARHAYWFPLILFGLIILAALPLYNDSGPLPTRTIPGPTGRLITVASRPLGYPANHSWGAALFWLLAVPLGYVATAAFYRVRARRTGLRNRIWPYVVGGLIIFVMLMVSAPGVFGLVSIPRWLVRWHVYVPDLFIRGLTPILVISLGFFVLARIERSWALFSISAVFLLVALLANLYNISNVFIRLGWIFPDWATNIAVSGGFLVFVGLVSFIVLRIGGPRHELSG